MSEMKHTKLPWHVGDVDAETLQINIIGEPQYGFYVCGVIAGVESQEANAEFIVRACNSYYDMLAVCKDVRGFLKRSGYDTKLVDDAIAKAEGRA